MLSFTAPPEQGALVFAAVFVVVWVGAAVVTLNAQLLGGTMYVSNLFSVHGRLTHDCYLFQIFFSKCMRPGLLCFPYEYSYTLVYFDQARPEQHYLAHNSRCWWVFLVHARYVEFG